MLVLHWLVPGLQSKSSSLGKGRSFLPHNALSTSELLQEHGISPSRRDGHLVMPPAKGVQAQVCKAPLFQFVVIGDRDCLSVH